MLRLKYIFCFMISTPLFGADIKLGEFQTLKSRIQKKEFTHVKIEQEFQKLVSRLSPQEKLKYNSIITQLIEAAHKEGIMLTLDGKQAVTSPTQVVENSIIKPEINPDKLAATPKSPQQKPPLIAPSGNKSSQPQSTETKSAAVNNDSKDKTPLVAEQPGPTVEKNNPQSLTPAQLRAIIKAIETLGKTYKKESLETLEKALAKIKSALGSALVPDNIAKPLKQLEEFKNKLAEDLKIITELSHEIIVKKIPELTKKQQLADPKIIKKSIGQISITEQEIKSFLAIYKNNTHIEHAVSKALEDLTKSFYTLIQQSMIPTSSLQDPIMVNKLIRTYAHGVQLFPVYSQKKLDLLAQAKIIKQNRSILEKLITGDHYLTMDPTHLDEQLIALENNASLFDLHERKQLFQIREYLDTTIDNIASLAQVDTIVQETIAFIATKSSNLIDIDEKLGKLIASQDIVTEIVTTQKELNGMWLLPQLQERLTSLDTLILKLDKLFTTAEELEGFAAFSDKFDTENLGFSIKDVIFSQPVVDRALKLEVPEKKGVIENSINNPKNDAEDAKNRLIELIGGN